LARKVAVTTGARRAGEVEILDGVQAGQSIITHGALKATDGAAVTIEATKTGD
jgi:membrane fusion protein (multidrug efflux system)